MENLFENFVKDFEHVLSICFLFLFLFCFVLFFFFVCEYLGCLIFLCGLLDDSFFLLIIFSFYFCTELIALPHYGQPNLV